MVSTQINFILLPKFSGLKVYHDIESFQKTGTVVTIGMFDGVHLGHRMLLDRVVLLSRELGGESTVITFWPHPRLVLYPDFQGLKYLSTLPEKIRLLSEASIENLLVLPFNLALAGMTACEFTEKILVGKLHIRHLVAGYNHQFGKDRKGSLEDLRKCAGNAGFGLEKLEAFRIGGTEISSTRIRNAISDGMVDTANKYLGYPYFILGRVVGGNRLGRSIGFPTANIELDDDHKLTPGLGVYAVKIQLNGEIFSGMLNIGFRPTIHEMEKKERIEVHIFDFDGDIYGQEVLIRFKKKIRDEMKFDNLTELKTRLGKDREEVIAWFGR
jgi:riboflavin kinase/FMN adenylyltransferase